VEAACNIESASPSQLTLAGREKILRLEEAVGRLPQANLPLRHFFCEGLYAREMTIPAGCVLVGYIHIYPCVNIVSKGEITIAMEDGLRRIKAPFTMVSNGGSKKAGYAHEETIWTTIHANFENLTDVEELEHILTADSYDDFLIFSKAILRMKEAP